MKKTLVAVLGAVLLLMCSVGPNSHAQTNSLRVMRLDYLVVTDSANSDGSTSRTTTTEVLWIADDGRTRTEQYNGIRVLQGVQLFNSQDHSIYRLDVQRKTAWHFSAPSAVHYSFDPNAPNSLPRTILGTGSIAGLQCRGTRASLPSGQQIETWGCSDGASGHGLQGSLEIRYPNGLHMRKDLTTFSRDVLVDSNLFAVPSDFRIIEGTGTAKQ